MALSKESLAVVNRSKDFEGLRESEAWKELEVHLSAIADERLKELLEYSGSDTNIMRYRQMAARAIRELNIDIKNYINDAVEAGRAVLIEELSRPSENQQEMDDNG